VRIEEQLLADSIRNTLYAGEKAVSKLTLLTYGNTPNNVEAGDHAERLQEEEESIRFHVEKAFRDVAILSERLALPQFAKEVRGIRKGIKNLARMEMHDGDHYCKPLNRVTQLFDSLASMTDGRLVSGLSVFETILHNTAKIIQARNLLPESEADVRSAVFEVLQFSFRDAAREIVLAKILKTYKADMGVKSLAAVAEYKFIDSKSEAKSTLDGIYADMKGYGGDHNWRSFYAVLYMTKPFFTQRDVDEEFRLVKAELSWTPIVIVGAGERKRKDKASK
jgi:hypothetical protein